MDTTRASVLVNGCEMFLRAQTMVGALDLFAIAIAIPLHTFKGSQ